MILVGDFRTLMVMMTCPDDITRMEDEVMCLETAEQLLFKRCVTHF